MSNNPPIEVPQGAIRLNTDSQRLEFFAQDRWYEFATENASDSGSRAFRVAGDNPANGTIIDIFNITTGGQAYDSGFDLSQGTGQMACAGSRTRAIVAGGFTGNPNFGAKQFIQYFEMAALSNSIDFGDLTYNSAGRNAGHSNNTRMVVTGSVDATNANVINLITISTTGNASDLVILFLFLQVTVVREVALVQYLVVDHHLQVHMPLLILLNLSRSHQQEIHLILEI